MIFHVGLGTLCEEDVPKMAVRGFKQYHLVTLLIVSPITAQNCSGQDRDMGTKSATSTFALKCVQDLFCRICCMVEKMSSKMQFKLFF